MGRGRAKAKQTKVARELKYRSYETDFSELQRGLHGDEEPRVVEKAESGDEEFADVDDPYVDVYDDKRSVNSVKR
ncbi:MAG: DUF3073 domain-containing protein [Nocardioidaceae bacterium]